MFKKEINFDRFVRGLICVAVLVLLYLLVRYLSPVLIPFFVAWFLAYMLHPLVSFLQHKCRLKNRVVSIFAAVLLVAGAATAIGYIIVPPFVEECNAVGEAASQYVSNGLKHQDSLPSVVKNFIDENLQMDNLKDLLKKKYVQAAIQKIVPAAWNVLSSTATVVIDLVASLIALLYLFFLLMDYDKYSSSWTSLVPRGSRPIVSQLAADLKDGMNGYFRGQFLVALSNCVLFSIGFLIIGFPMPIGLGCFIGLISFVPYLQVVGFLPAIVLALLCSAQTGRNFWVLMLLVVAVYLVVQVIQDVLVTPKVMGKYLGLSPAVILLSLSVWGYMLGIIGLIIALPLTTIMISYYKRYVVGESDEAAAPPPEIEIAVEPTAIQNSEETPENPKETNKKIGKI